MKLIKGFLVLVGAVTLLVILASVGGDSQSGNATRPQPTTRQGRIESLFSAWDGSLPALVKIVKAAMNDPDSFKHVSTRYADKTNFLLVYMKYRGKNAFGGVVTETIKAKVNLNGNVVEILESP